MQIPGPCTHAGGVIYRSDRGAPQWLIVRSSDGAAWVLPKGHIEPGESTEEAAIRELREEAGVEVTLVRALTVRYIAYRSIVVAYFLAHLEREGLPHESRDQQWLVKEDALRLLSYQDAKDVLDEAARELHAMSGL